MQLVQECPIMLINKEINLTKKKNTKIKRILTSTGISFLLVPEIKLAL
jgi:hypothetical protein